MHTGPVPGEFKNDWKPVVMAGFTCRKCNGLLEYRNWESSCGGYDDTNYRCTGCGHSWWVESSDL